MYDKKYLISVIIPVYNVEKYLERCLDSVINQTYDNLEIILVNDGSVDNSGEICDYYAKKDKRINVIHKRNNGVSSTRNEGLEIAKGDYITFVDSDDYLEMDAYEECIKKNAIQEPMDNVEKFDIIKMSHNIIKNNKKSNSIKKNGIYNSKDYIEEIIRGKIGGHCWGYLINKDLIAEICFDENTSYMEDTLFMINCILKTDRIKYIDTGFYNHIINSEGITCSKTKILKNINDFIYSLNEIEKIIISREKEFDVQNAILMKKTRLIEAEIAKVSKKEEIRPIFENKAIIDTLEEARTIENHIIYKMFISIIINKKYTCLKIYLKTRNWVKSSKK